MNPLDRLAEEARWLREHVKHCPAIMEGMLACADSIDVAINQLEQEGHLTITKLLKRQGAQEALDSLVQEVASREATRVNNSGVKDQIEFLNRNGMDDDDIIQWLDEATA